MSGVTADEDKKPAVGGVRTDEDKKPAVGGVRTDGDKKPAVGGVRPIRLMVRGQDGNDIFFCIKKATQLKKLMNAYCDRLSVDLNSIAFLFNGRRLSGEQTPNELEMEEGDEIEVMLHQTGG